MKAINPVWFIMYIAQSNIVVYLPAIQPSLHQNVLRLLCDSIFELDNLSVFYVITAVPLVHIQCIQSRVYYIRGIQEINAGLSRSPSTDYFLNNLRVRLLCASSKDFDILFHIFMTSYFIVVDKSVEVENSLHILKALSAINDFKSALIYLPENYSTPSLQIFFTSMYNRYKYARIYEANRRSDLWVVETPYEHLRRSSVYLPLCPHYTNNDSIQDFDKQHWKCPPSALGTYCDAGGSDYRLNGNYHTVGTGHVLQKVVPDSSDYACAQSLHRCEWQIPNILDSNHVTFIRWLATYAHQLWLNGQLPDPSDGGAASERTDVHSSPCIPLLESRNRKWLEMFGHQVDDADKDLLVLDRLQVHGARDGTGKYLNSPHASQRTDLIYLTRRYSNSMPNLHHFCKPRSCEGIEEHVGKAMRRLLVLLKHYGH